MVHQSTNLPPIHIHIHYNSSDIEDEEEEILEEEQESKEKDDNFYNAKLLFTVGLLFAITVFILRSI